MQAFQKKNICIFWVAIVRVDSLSSILHKSQMIQYRQGTKYTPLTSWAYLREADYKEAI